MSKAYFGKRQFDFFLSLLFLIVLSPFMVLLVLVYVIAGKGPLLFRQQRIGLNETEFTLLKVRTLGTNEATPVEHRTFALGNWLRRTGLDELPQLLNVVKGDMSLVGPRPLPTYYQQLFSMEQRMRFEVRPGITGLTQISGGSQLSWPEKFRYDQEYVQRNSFLGDIIILWKTIGVILGKKDDGLQEKPFTGI